MSSGRIVPRSTTLRRCRWQRTVEGDRVLRTPHRVAV